MFIVVHFAITRLIIVGNDYNIHFDYHWSVVHLKFFNVPD